MSVDDESEAFESAVARLPYPVFVVDGASRLRAMNEHARKLWAVEHLHESQLERSPIHPISTVIHRLRTGGGGGDESAVVQLASGSRYEVIHSTRSPKGDARWLILMLRPFPTQASVDVAAVRTRWSLTPREAEVAAACIIGRTSAEICEALSISRETLKTHMARLLDKADCENRTQLIAKYLFGE